MLRPKLIAVLFFVTLTISGARADEPKPDDGSRWEKEIAAFEREDKMVRHPVGATVFVGSSSIRLWDLQKSFPNYPTINRGFGGSQIVDSVQFADRIVNVYEPPIIVFYAGDNDIASGKSPDEVLADYQAFVASVRAKLPEAKIVYIGIKPSIARWKLVDKIRAANQLIQAETEKDERQTFIDVDGLMIGDDGLPRKELFRDDGLHLSEAGYELWSKLVTPHLPAPSVD